MAKDKEYLQEAADSIYQANADEIVRQQCRAREEAECRERTLERDIKLLQKDNANLMEDNVNLKKDNKILKEDIEKLKRMVKEMRFSIAN